MTNIAVLVSGGGTNLQSVIDAVSDGRIPDADIVLVISSKEDVYALERAKKAGIDTAVITSKEWPDEEKRDRKLHELLTGAETDLVLTLGYLSIIGPNMIDEFKGRIINIHPSLLPSHGGMGYFGKKVHEAVLAAGDKFSGATVHYVTEVVDGGGIICCKKTPVFDDDTPDSLAKRVLEIEHELIVEGVNIHLKNRYGDKKSE